MSFGLSTRARRGIAAAVSRRLRGGDTGSGGAVGVGEALDAVIGRTLCRGALRPQLSSRASQRVIVVLRSQFRAAHVGKPQGRGSGRGDQVRSGGAAGPVAVGPRHPRPDFQLLNAMAATVSKARAGQARRQSRGRQGDPGRDDPWRRTGDDSGGHEVQGLPHASRPHRRRDECGDLAERDPGRL